MDESLYIKSEITSLGGKLEGAKGTVLLVFASNVSLTVPLQVCLRRFGSAVGCTVL